MTKTTQPLPPTEKDLRSAKRQFADLYGSAIVSGNYLKIAVLCLAATCLGLLVLNLKTYQTFSERKPLVIRINDIGRAEAVEYDAVTYQPRDAEIRYFLIEFVTKHYGRMRATARENFARSLFFLDGRSGRRGHRGQQEEQDHRDIPRRTRPRDRSRCPQRGD